MAQQILNMTAPPEVYTQRRSRLAAGLKRPLVILAGRARARTYAGLDYPFRAGSTYLYFGGPPIEGAAWIIEPNSDGMAGSTLLRPLADPDDAVWTGEPVQDDVIAAAAGVSVGAIRAPRDIEELLAKRESASICPPCPASLNWVTSLGLQPAAADELLQIIDMRNVKDDHELTAMRDAADIGADAHEVAMACVVAGRSEAEIAAAFESTLIAGGCVASFTPIVTVRGEILHCLGYNNTMNPGDLLLVDGGAAEPGGYASDNTRVCPVSREFTAIQKQLYNVVLRAEREAIAACVPGRRYRDVHDLAARVICEGLIEADLLRGEPDDLAERRAHTLFFPHGVGHLIGLDTHDMEDFGDLAGYAPGRERRTGFGDNALRLDRDLEVGMTVTIEPGIYIVPAIWARDDLVSPFADCVNRAAVDALIESHFGGIRLEDIVHVRAQGGPENITEELPIETDAVIEAMKLGDEV